MFCYSAGATNTQITQTPTTPITQPQAPEPEQHHEVEHHEPQPQATTHNEPQPGPSRQGKRKEIDQPQKSGPKKKTKTWYNDNPEQITIDGKDVLVIRAEKIPGQKRINEKMTDEEKLETAANNEKIRAAAVAQAEKEIGKKIMLTGKFLNLGIPEGGYYHSDKPEHKNAILKTATKKPTTTQAKETTTTQIEKPATGVSNVQSNTEDEGPQIEQPPVTVQVTSRNLTTLTIVCEGTKTIIYLYEDEQQLKDQFKSATPNTLKVTKQPTEEKININVVGGRSNLWPTITFKLRELTQNERSEIYYKTYDKIRSLYGQE